MPSHSLERLIKLAQKTGGKLIVQNQFENHDVVILDVEEYERLVLEPSMDWDFGRDDVRELSGSEMLDRINRDIAIWRADKEQEEEWEKEMALEDEADEMDPFDPFAEHDYHPTEWHEHLEGEKVVDVDKKEEEKKEEPAKQTQPSNWHSVSDVLDKKYQSTEEIKIEDIPFKPQGVDSAWQEEPLSGDEPVFYEEPV